MIVLETFELILCQMLSFAREKTHLQTPISLFSANSNLKASVGIASDQTARGLLIVISHDHGGLRSCLALGATEEKERTGRQGRGFQNGF